MTIEEFVIFNEKMASLQNQNKKYIERQNELSSICKEKAQKYYEIEDKIHELYKKGLEKNKNKFHFVEDDLTGFERTILISQEYLRQTDKAKEIHNLINSIPELKEAGEMENDRAESFFKFAMSFCELNNYINESKKKTFSKEYLKKMDEYAKDGIMLYFLEIPDMPILDKDITEKDVLESFLFNGCYNLCVLYKTFIECPSPGASMKRKIKDILDSIFNLANGCYRTAARTLFSLLESEIKKTSKALEGYFEKEKKYKNGKERSQRIEELTNKMNFSEAINEWKHLNEYYETIVTSKNTRIDRNLIIHGDYDDELMDISAQDVVKLFLLYLCIRQHSDNILNYVNIYENAITYSIVYFTNELKNKE